MGDEEMKCEKDGALLRPIGETTLNIPLYGCPKCGRVYWPKKEPSPRLSKRVR